MAVFVSDKTTNFEWKESALQIADNSASETAKIFTAIIAEKELQFVAYTRTLTAGQDIVYGYFAMKDLKSKKNSADFIDAQGKGVKEFEKFRKTVGVSK